MNQARLLQARPTAGTPHKRQQASCPCTPPSRYKNKPMAFAHLLGRGGLQRGDRERRGGRQHGRHRGRLLRRGGGSHGRGRRGPRRHGRRRGSGHGGHVLLHHRGRHLPGRRQRQRVLES